MGIREEIGKRLSGGSKRTRCSQDPNSGDLQCKFTRVNKDGTEEMLAMGRWGVGNDKQIKILDFEENEEGAFKELEKNVLPRLRNISDRNIPADY